MVSAPVLATAISMYSRSSIGSPSNTALKVLSWPRSEVASGASSLSSSLMKPTMVVESRPPERQEPTGTSETRRRSTLSRKRRLKSAGSGLPSWLSFGVQYGVLVSAAVRGPLAASPPNGSSIQVAAGTW